MTPQRTYLSKYTEKRYANPIQHVSFEHKHLWQWLWPNSTCGCRVRSQHAQQRPGYTDLCCRFVLTRRHPAECCQRIHCGNVLGARRLQRSHIFSARPSLACRRRSLRVTAEFNSVAKPPRVSRVPHPCNLYGFICCCKAFTALGQQLSFRRRRLFHVVITDFNDTPYICRRFLSLPGSPRCLPLGSASMTTQSASTAGHAWYGKASGA